MKLSASERALMSKLMQRVRSKGGKRRAKALSAERRSEIARGAAETRWQKAREAKAC